MSSKPHPLKAWRERSGLSQEQVATLVRSELPGSKFSGPYLSQIENGVRVPAWELAKAIGSVTREAVTAVVIMDWRDEETPVTATPADPLAV